MIGSALLVVVVEVLNTAIEAVVDRIGPERHELSGLGKGFGFRRGFMFDHFGDSGLGDIVARLGEVIIRSNR